MVDFAKSFLVPGSLSVLAAGLVAGVALLYGPPRARRWARAWLTLLLLVYAALAVPACAGLLRLPLKGGLQPIDSRNRAQGIETVVVLSTGGFVYRAHGEEVAEMGRSTAYNALEAARLYRLLAPARVIVSGGIVETGSRRQTEAETLAAGLVALGVPRDRLVMEARSRTTREQAVNVAALLRRFGTTRFLLVTGGSHMARATASFRHLGLAPVACVSRDAGDESEGWRRFVPSLHGLDESRDTIYEYAARLYYWTKGWTATPGR